MPTNRVFGPIRPSKLALMGIRFADGDDGNAPATPDTPDAPESKIEAPKPTPPAREDVTDWKAEARKHEARSKEWQQKATANAEAAKRLAEIEESQKSEQQKLEERAANAEKLAAEREADALRARVALEKGLTPSQEKRLVGKTREELLADADELLADLGSRKAPVPKPDPSAGPKAPVKPASLQGAISAHYEAE